MFGTLIRRRIGNMDPNASQAVMRTGHPRRWAILALVLAAECMDLLDGTIVNVAAPTVRASLHASASALQWIIGGYALAFAAGMIAGARLGDRYGRKRLFAPGAGGLAGLRVRGKPGDADRLPAGPGRGRGTAHPAGPRHHQGSLLGE